MNRYFEDASVGEWSHLIGAIQLPDPNDEHVVAAALVGRADVIVTNNLRDFPLETLHSLGLDVQTPDEFLLNQLDLDTQQVMTCLDKQSRALQNPAVTVAEILDRLHRCGAIEFSKAASKQLWRLS